MFSISWISSHGLYQQVARKLFEPGQTFWALCQQFAPKDSIDFNYSFTLDIFQNLLDMFNETDEFHVACVSDITS